MKRIHSFFQKKKNRKKEKRIFLCAKKYLKPGLYCCQNSMIRKINFKDIRLQNVFSYYVKFNNGKSRLIGNQIFEYTNAEYTFGYGKDVFIFDDIVVGFYKRHEFFEMSKNNYQKHIKASVYPFVKVISFNDAEESVIMQKVIGVHYNDKKHDDYLIEKLFLYALESPICVSDNGEYTYLQHGDMKRENTIWTDENTFIFIDLDGTSYLPLFFDILHYCAMINMNLDEIINVIDSHLLIVKQVFGKFNLSIYNNYLDFIFYYYALFFARLGDCFEDIAFLTDADLSAFPKTNGLLHSLLR